MRYLGLLFALVSVTPASAQEVVGALPVIERSLADVIGPAHARFAARTGAQKDAITAYCEGQGSIEDATGTFAETVKAFAAVEPYRFGPARQDNLYEKLYFWPDRRGITGRQVRGLLADETLGELTGDQLAGKSVAVQGLAALEIVLVQAPEPGTPACHYATVLAQLIDARAATLSGEWLSSAGYPQAMLAPSTPYQSHTEVIAALVKALSEQLQITAQLKLARAMGESPSAARPQLLPFQASGNHLAALAASAAAMGEMFSKGGLATLLEPESLWIDAQFTSEIERAQEMLKAASTVDDPFAGEEGRSLLTNAVIALQGALDLLDARYAPAIGLTLGFNSTDGD